MSCHWKMEEDQVSRSWEYVKGSSGEFVQKQGFSAICSLLCFFSHSIFQSSKT